MDINIYLWTQHAVYHKTETVNPEEQCLPIGSSLQAQAQRATAAQTLNERFEVAQNPDFHDSFMHV